MTIFQNDFIAYLNSLHNLGASGANALAESQALSPYFGELYEPFPLIDRLVDVLKSEPQLIVILTGHAGDGKSTVALDVLKKLRNLPPTDPLSAPLNEREEVRGPSGGLISIVKDMSELSAERRQQWLGQAFSEPGSWLIVSNTGPLLHSLSKYAMTAGYDQDIESAVLKQLDQPINDGPLDAHSLDMFGKRLIILNLTRLDNVVLGARILTKLVGHSAWKKCNECNVKQSCPLRLNRDALFESGTVAEERVRWIYQRLNAYEQRLTLRQIVAQLAFGLTGGMSCDEAYNLVAAPTDEGVDRSGVGLERILFSEGFFGYRGGKPWPQAEGLHAIALVRRSTFGGPVGVDYERRLPFEVGLGWAAMPPSLESIGRQWRVRAAESAGVRWRFALRRMTYLFGRIEHDKDQLATVFLDTFLLSPSLREFDQWQNARKLTLSRIDANRLRLSCLQVLLEIYSGFTASQFNSRHESLYLTLRRSDLTVVQPTQLVLDTLPFRNFDLKFDSFRNVPVLSFDRGRAELVLTLPLLDYIRRRDTGEVGSALSPIHQGQLDWFRAVLLEVTVDDRRRHDDEIELLRAGIDGEVHLHRYLLDQDRCILEQG